MGILGLQGIVRSVLLITGVLLCFALLLPGCGSGDSADARVTVIIETAPEDGANVIFLQEPRGVSPLTLPNIIPGPYDVYVDKEFYKSALKRIVVMDTPAEQRFTINMEPRVGLLSIESVPARAEVYMDGEESPIGQTPLIDQPLLIGDHTYTLRLENHYEITQDISIEESFKYSKRHELKPREASIEIYSTPSGATVYINNTLQERTTPLTIELKPDTYLVTIKAEGYIEKDERVILKAAEAKRIDIAMIKGNVPPGMVLVPGGEFIMGASDRAPDEAPRRTVTLAPFFIDKFEVSNEQFKQVFPLHTFPVGMEIYPVSGVSWEQATDYAKAVGKRLPTEAEWEKAARGTDGREFPWGVEFNQAYCNTKEARRDALNRLDAYLEGVSPYGCINMSGNVYEWVQDWYQAYPGNVQVTKDYGQVFRVLRGGSYLTERFEARCARRHFDRMDARKADYGFRCAMDGK